MARRRAQQAEIVLSPFQPTVDVLDVYVRWHVSSLLTSVTLRLLTGWHFIAEAQNFQSMNIAARCPGKACGRYLLDLYQHENCRRETSWSLLKSFVA